MVNVASIVVNDGQEQKRLSDYVYLNTIPNMQENNPLDVHVVLKVGNTYTYKGFGPVMYEEGAGILQVGEGENLVAYFDDGEYAANVNADGYMFFKTANQMGGARKRVRKTRKGPKGKGKGRRLTKRNRK